MEINVTKVMSHVNCKMTATVATCAVEQVKPLQRSGYSGCASECSL